MPWYSIHEDAGRLHVRTRPAGKPGTARKHEGEVACNPGVTKAQVAEVLKGLPKPAGTPDAGRERLAVIRDRLAAAGLADLPVLDTAALKAAREAASLTQPQAAELARIGQSYWSMVESGQREPSLTNLRAMARAVGVPMGSLLRG